MSSLVIKVGSLLVKTLSKPIANRIKAQAREHERFRRVCINVAQGIHRWDMRFRLGLLQDTAAIEKQIAKEAAEHQAKKHKHEAPTAKTEAHTKADEAAAAREKESGEKSKPKSSSRQPKIRPLSEAKAIDLGANFVSETFLFVVGVGLILFENWRRGRQETSRREDVADRLNDLESSERLARKYYAEALVKLEDEIIALQEKKGMVTNHHHRILPKPVWELAEKEDKEDERKGQGWLSWIPRFNKRDAPRDETETEAPQSTESIISPQDSSHPPSSILGKLSWPPRSHPRDISPAAPETSPEKPPNNTPTNSKPSQ